ncbi:MAG: response regulator transcription factor [Bacteroidales bacterium]|nr:response regulator transcription factor [Bacteroidales bacterium]
MERILVVDDEQDLCEILRFNLEAEGYAVDTASSAEEALAKILPPAFGTHPMQPYSLLLLDIMMGGMSGIDLAKTLRARGDNTPVIFLTARDAHDDQLEGFSAGADDYIVKPFAFDTVLARIRAVLRRCEPAKGPRDATMAGMSSLTRREYLILKLFTDYPGRYFTREEILAAVWPGDSLVGERSVDVHIARLRKKLGPEGGRIVNKIGFGYGLV